MRLYCNECWKSVSTEVPDDTVVRAILTCPECFQQMVKDGRWRDKEEAPRLTDERFRQMAEAEDGCIVSAGGLVADIGAMEAEEMRKTFDEGAG